MGLDQYAYTISKTLVTAEHQVNVNVASIARASIGFKDLSEQEFALLSSDAKSKYYTDQTAATKEAQKRWLINLDFAYWRKFNHLHGWMEQLYQSKGGTGDFNCNTVRLEPNNIDVLESLAKLKALAPTAGFFFGGNEPFNDEDRDEVLEFISKCRTAFEQNNAVFYDSWW